MQKPIDQAKAYVVGQTRIKTGAKSTHIDQLIPQQVQEPCIDQY